MASEDLSPGAGPSSVGLMITFVGRERRGTVGKARTKVIGVAMAMIVRAGNLAFMVSVF